MINLGKQCSNINLYLSDFGISKSTVIPAWLSNDNLDELLAMSLLHGDLDHFIVTILNNEVSWKKWYENPFIEEMPKIQIELSNSSNLIMDFVLS